MINQRFFNALYEYSKKLNKAVQSNGTGKSSLIDDRTYQQAENENLVTASPPLPENENLKKAKGILFKTQQEYQESYMALISDVKVLQDRSSWIKENYKAGLTSAKGKRDKLATLSLQAEAFLKSVRDDAGLFYVQTESRQLVRNSLNSINNLVQHEDIMIKGKLMGKEEESSAYKELNPLVKGVSHKVDDVIQKRAKLNLVLYVINVGVELEKVEAATQDALIKVNGPGVTPRVLADILYTEATTDNVVAMRTANFPKSGIIDDDFSGTEDKDKLDKVRLDKVKLQTYLGDREKLLAPVVNAISDLKMKLLEQIECIPLHAVEGEYEKNIKKIADELGKLSDKASNASNDELAKDKEPMLTEIKKLEVELGMVQQLAISKNPAPTKGLQAGPSVKK